MDESILFSSIIDKCLLLKIQTTLKHGKDVLSHLVQLGSHLRIEESLRAQDSDKGKGKEVVGPSVNMTEEGKNKNNKQNKGKKRDFKEHGIGMDSNKETYKLNVGSVVKTGHFQEGFALVVDAIAWWIDSGATTHWDVGAKYFHATTSLGNKKYVITFINDASRFCYVYLLHAKDEALDKFRIYKIEVELQQSDLIKTLRTDRGGEYYDPVFFQSVGIIHETRAPYTPQQNGVAERKNRALKEMVNSMLSYSGLSEGFWGEAMLTACYLLNRVPNKRDKTTPYELWYKKRPNLSFLRVLGGRLFRLPEPQKENLGEKGIDCIFVGYAEAMSKASRYQEIKLDHNTLTVIVLRKMTYSPTSGHEPDPRMAKKQSDQASRQVSKQASGSTNTPYDLVFPAMGPSLGTTQPTATITSTEDLQRATFTTPPQTAPGTNTTEHAHPHPYETRVRVRADNLTQGKSRTELARVISISEPTRLGRPPHAREETKRDQADLQAPLTRSRSRCPQAAGQWRSQSEVSKFGLRGQSAQAPQDSKAQSSKKTPRNEDAETGHWKSKNKYRGDEDEDMSRPWRRQKVDAFTRRISDFSEDKKRRMLQRFMNGINNPELIKRLNDRVPQTFDELMKRTRSFIQGEAAAADSRKGYSNNRSQEQSRRQSNDQSSSRNNSYRGQRGGRGNDKYTPLTMTPKEILATEGSNFPKPPPMRTPEEQRVGNGYCEYHRQKGHTTNECVQLRQLIDKLVKEGRLDHLVKNIKEGKDKQRSGGKKDAPRDKADTIYMVQSWQRKTKQKVSQKFSPDGRWQSLSHFDCGLRSGGSHLHRDKCSGHDIHRKYIDGGASETLLYNNASNRLRP
ncbi:reverse transcriptase domain-containing protein [Tanacetum coccineum]